MQKKFDDTLLFINKFVGSLLAVLVGAALTANAKLGTVIGTTEALSANVAEMNKSVAHNTTKLAVLESQNKNILVKTNKIEAKSDLTSNIQIERTKRIECSDKISEVLGCDIPKDHP